MAKRKKTSRKGTKAWRANIPTRDVDDYVDRAARTERSGGALDALSDEGLFFVDKSSDISLVKRTSKYRERLLRCDAILERSSLVPPLLVPKRRCKKAKSVKRKLSNSERKEVTRDTNVHFDIWSSGDNESKVQQDRPKNLGRPQRSTTTAAAVEIDVPGCSYNPRFEDHQEALGLAVAHEMQKVYKKELEPLPIPRTVQGTTVDEEDVYFLDVDDGDDADEPEIEEGALGLRPIKVKKLTRAELNKKKRKKEQLKIEEQSQKRAKVAKDVLRLEGIVKDIEIEEQNKHREWTRRTIAKQEKQAEGPPRLGKHRFQPQPVQVLLSEELTGSLRKLKGCYSLAKERYISLQQRGLIEPRVPGKRRARRKRVTFEEGSKGQKEREMHGMS